MTIENRTVIYDFDLGIEAYHFQGIIQPFPNHFHAYYVMGFVEEGKRQLTVKQQDYFLKTGDIVLFNPFDPHACNVLEDSPLNYRALNIKTEILAKAVYDITGKHDLPHFQQPILLDSDLGDYLSELHQALFLKKSHFEKEELFYFFIRQLLAETNFHFKFVEQATQAQISLAVDYLEQHYTENISLEDLSQLTGLSKYYFLRFFTKEQGITPFQYLQAFRISKAKDLLERQLPLIEVAGLTGFHDQSHFSNTFKKCIGLTPKQYQSIFKSTT